MQSMPDVARSVLLCRILREPALAQLVRDVRTLAGVKVIFAADEDGRPCRAKAAVTVVTRVGSIELGRLLVTDPLPPDKAGAVQRWLDAAAEKLVAGLARDSVHGTKALPGAVARAASILRNRFHEPITLGMVAREAGVSRERLSRLFRSVMGITFSEYLNVIRLDHCRRRLADSNQTITEIAFASGFQSVSQFNRRFKAAEGVSPRDYRKRQRLAG